MRLDARKPNQGRGRDRRASMARALLACLCIPILVSLHLSSSLADESSQPDYADQKVAAPTIAQYLVEETDSDAWQTVADYPQGMDIPFKLLGTLPEDLTRRPRLAYWLVAELAEGMDYVEGSARVYVVHANGTEEDVTDSLTVSGSNEEVFAGADNIRPALPKLVGTDRLRLEYVTRFNDAALTGFERGNRSYGHVEYRGALFLPQTDASTVASRIPIRALPLVSHLVSLAASDVTNARGADLLRSPDMQTTVYTYDLEVHKQDDKTGAPLAGASFALHDDQGLWYVRGDDWSRNKANATAYTTDDKGVLLFPLVDSEKYELVEVEAPEGYDAVDPVDVAITTDVEDGDSSATVLRASSTKAVKVDADARTGLVRLFVADPESDSHNPGDNDNPQNPDDGSGDNTGDNSGDTSGDHSGEGGSNASDGSGGSNGAGSDGAGGAGTQAGGAGTQGADTGRRPSLLTSFLARLLGRTPRTGDYTAAAWVGFASASVLALLCGLALRRGAGRMDTHRSSADTGCAGRKERI